MTLNVGFKRKDPLRWTALLTQKELIIKSFKSNNVTSGIFSDYSGKAFDHINHKYVNKKLNAYSVRGQASSILESYLLHPKQYVSKTNPFSSTIENISTREPRGSILGPLLFLIYINDVFNITSEWNFIAYEDNIRIFITRNDVNRLVNTANAVLELSYWTNETLLTINTNKHRQLFLVKK